MSEVEYDASEHYGRYLVFKSEVQDTEQYERHPDTERQKGMDHLHNGLMAFQIIKPSQTSGFSFHSLEFAGNLYPEAVNRRAPMEVGQWARMRSFTPEFFSQVPELIGKILAVMGGSRAEMKNAIILLQLCLEQSHPLIAGLLAMMGMEAIFDSGGRDEFKRKLCHCLGASTLAFPDWNKPLFTAPQYTVEEIAIPVYMLRNKLAHGADLRKASTDKTTPVDLVKKVTLVPEFEQRAHAYLLAEAACYLLCQVLQRVL